jgi:hypothetical protein
VEQSFLHELVHWIFHMMSAEKLRDDEVVVDLFTQFLYQALRTSEPMPQPDLTAEELEEICGSLAPEADDEDDNYAEPFCCADDDEEDDPHDDEMEEPWTDAADRYERSNDEGWFYGDDD